MTTDIEKKYKKHELRTHIYTIPDTYIGSTDFTQIKTYIYDNDKNKMIEKTISYIPGLYKIFDEIIVNAIDQSVRLKIEEKNGKENIKNVKNIKVNIEYETGWIHVYNDGNGIDIAQHSDYENIWIPELVFGELLTSTNYNIDEEKIVGGKNGFGSKLTNIFSKQFIIETIDASKKKIYKQVFKNNMTEKENPEIKSCARQPYTKISFLPDYERFGLKGLTQDIYDLFIRRVYDASATTNKEVNIYLNDKKLNVKDFEKYVDLFLDSKSEQPRIYESPNERWEIITSISKNGSFEQISFVNGINTLKGGKHVDYIVNSITKNLSEMILTKKKKTIKQQHIKDNLFIFIKSTISNPSFDSQTKETLTTTVSKFGSKCELSDKFYEKLFKTDILDKVLSLTDIVDQKKLEKTDGKKINRIIVPKLDDANNAGTKNSSNCTLILTEGDSAKTMAISGLSVIGRDNYGVFPLRGKILNVKDISSQKIADNTEITALKKILGLEQNKNYTDISTLRYGSIMIMTDQDHDGSHIKGLLFNVFQTLWHSLYKTEGFLTSMLTPIIKVTNNKTKEVISFYSITDYDKWVEHNDINNWKLKYYKGLGTSNENEAKEYFKNMKKIKYEYTDKSDEFIDLAFNKKRANDRKSWLMNYDKKEILNYDDTKINYETFINKDLIHFSNRDLERSINHLCDGLKESTRKILYACFKKKLYTNEIKVAQLAGYVSEVTSYHHGEASLQQAIIGMAQIFVGTNNINLLVPNGQFGTRILSNGSDASSPRYIYTLLSKLALLIFKEEDFNILTNQYEDGDEIEPEYYIPIIPMILVNGGIGIGTGFSTNIPQYNPEDIINICKMICDTINDEKDIEKIKELINNLTITELIPYYLGFKGKIENNEKNSYCSKGIYKWINENDVEITELPVGTWTEDYKIFLEEMVQKNKIKNFENHYTTKNVKFIINSPSCTKENFEQEFKLISTKNLSLNNLHLYTNNGNIKKYENTTEIIKEWSIIRIIKYIERKEKQIKVLEDDLLIISTKIRFITDIINNTIQIMNKKHDEVIEQLNKLEYPINSDEYLLKMPIFHLTYEKKINLENQELKIKNDLEKLRDLTISNIWKKELDELLEEWYIHKKNIETDYENENGKENTKTQRKKRISKK